MVVEVGNALVVPVPVYLPCGNNRVVTHICIESIGVLVDVVGLYGVGVMVVVCSVVVEVQPTMPYVAVSVNMVFMFVNADIIDLEILVPLIYAHVYSINVSSIHDVYLNVPVLEKAYYKVCGVPISVTADMDMVDVMVSLDLDEIDLVLVVEVFVLVDVAIV